MVFQCTQQENELGLINAYHRHCKCPYFWFPNTDFILSLLHRTFSHLLRGGNPEIQSARTAAQSPGFWVTSSLTTGCVSYGTPTYELKGQVVFLRSHTQCAMVRQGQNSHVDTISEKKGNWEMLSCHWSVASLKHH